MSFVFIAMLMFFTFEVFQNAPQSRWICGFGILSALLNFVLCLILGEVLKHLKQARKEVKNAYAAKKSFLAHVSHELRSPLNAILGFTQELSRTGLTNQQHEYIDIVYKSGEHLLGLIKDLFHLAKIEAQQITLVSSTIDLYDVLDGLTSVYQCKAEAKGLSFHLHVDAKLSRLVEIDSVRLRQILINLLENALKFTESGTITLKASSRFHRPSASQSQLSLELIFTVEDTGIGILPTEIQSIFDAFTQADSGSLQKEGLGLGLAICQQYAQLMDGEVTVQSTPGEGSSFTVSLMCQESKDLEIDIQSHAITGMTAWLNLITPSDYRILVVDDNSVNRQLLQNLLKRKGFQLKEACNGQEALEKVSLFQPHLILMDIRMPILNGYDATQKIKAMPSSPYIIALSALSSELAQNAALAAGCDAFLEKPIDELQLFTLLKSCFLPIKKLNSVPRSNLAYAKSDADITESISIVKPPWQSEFYRATLQGDIDQMLILINSLKSEYPMLSHQLKKCAQEYQFDVLLNCTKPYVEENYNV